MKNAFVAAWSILDPRERSKTIWVMLLMIAGALVSALMVAAVFPFLSILANPSEIERIKICSWAYEFFGFSSNYQFLVALGISVITIIAITNLFMILHTWVITRYVERNSYSISRRLLAKYLSQEYEFFLGRHSGEMSTKVLSEAEKVIEMFLRPLAEFISSSLTIIAILSTLFILSPTTSLATLMIFATVYGAIVVLSRRIIKKLGMLRATNNAKRYRSVSDALGGIKDIKLLGREFEFLEAFDTAALQLSKVNVEIKVIAEVPRYGMQIIAFSGIILLCLILIGRESLNSQGAMAHILPLIGILVFAGQRLLPEVQKLYYSATMMTAAAEPIRKIYEDLSVPSLTGDTQESSTRLRLHSKLDLRGIHYRYPNAELPALKCVELVIRAGERIGVVGPSGAGKTTLVDNVLGLLLPQSGEIRVDGTLISTENRRSWQRTVGYVPQTIFLIDASISENIALGFALPDIDLSRLERAARLANLHDFIMRDLPNGYETTIGERGVRLSGGQRQRIGIARALYRDVDLIIFDEGTSALDSINEREIISALETLPEDKTLIIVTHRIAAVKNCHRIILMEDGRVVDLGSWEELVLRNETFRSLSYVA